MGVVMWIVAGGALGWIGYSVLGFNEARGKLLSIAIGAFGAVIGGKELAPIFSTPIVGEFNTTAMMFALALASAFLVVSHVIHSQWNI